LNDSSHGTKKKRYIIIFRIGSSINGFVFIFI
jgi:hypothetical protein